MKGEVVWENYRGYTKDLTEFSRKLAFAAAAICWFFRTPSYKFPSLIILALTLLVGYFFCDVLQYFVAALKLRRWIRDKEIEHYDRTGKLDGDFDMPEHLDRLPFRLWWTKIVMLQMAFVFIVAEFMHRLFV